MNRFILFITFPILLYTLTGDISPIPDSTAYSDSAISINFAVNSQNLIVLAKLKYYGYFGILYNTKAAMSSGDYTIIEISNGDTITAKDQYTGAGEYMPTPDTKNDITILGSDTDKSTYTTVKFQRKLNTGDTQDLKLSVGQSIFICYAFRQGSLTLQQHNDNQKKCFSTTVSNNGVVAQSASGPNFKYVHGVLLTLGWCFFADIAIFLVFWRQFKYNILFHGICFTITLILSAVQILIVVIQNDAFNIKLNDLTNTHFIIGITILIWVFLQYIGGIISRLFQYLHIDPKFQVFLRIFHKYSGYILVILCKVQVYIGWTMWKSTLGQVLVIIQFIIFICFILAMYLFKKSISTQQLDTKSSQSQLSSMSNEKLAVIFKKPYSSKELAKYNYFIFNNQVYEVQETGIHPGGQFIMERIKGRQIDRFLYGMYQIQQHPNLSPVVHPSNSLALFNPPIYTLSGRKLYTINNPEFYISQKLEVAQSVYMLYLKPKIKNALIYEQKQNLQFIGQYFTLKGFGKHRLYTCVACQRPQNRLLRSQLLKSLGLIQKQEQIKYETQQSLPLIIKHYKFQNTFTNQLFDIKNYDKQLNIWGLNGRGLGLQYLPAGKVILFAGGTGLFPYLDLLDLLFKRIASQKIKYRESQIQNHQKKLLKNQFELYCAIAHTDDLIMPLELCYMTKANSPLFKMKLKLTKNTNNMFDHCITKDRFNKKFIKDEISVRIDEIAMIYVCGPPPMYKDLLQGFKESNIPDSKVFLV